MENDLRLIISKIDIEILSLEELVKLIVESELLIDHKKTADKKGIYNPNSEAICSFVQAKLPLFYKEIERREIEYRGH